MRDLIILFTDTCIMVCLIILRKDIIPITWQYIIIGLIAGVNSIVVYWQFQKPRTSLSMKEYLKLIINSIWNPQDEHHFKSNIMLYKNRRKFLFFGKRKKSINPKISLY